MTTILNPGGDGPENIERAAVLLRASKQNLEVFRAMYTGNKQWKSLEEIRDKITTFNTNTDKAARRLHGENILDRKMVGRTVVYGKKQFYNHNRDKILTLSRNKARLNSFPTKRRPAGTAKQASFRFKTRPKVRQIYLDDIDTFKAVKKVRKADASVLKGMPERTINRALCTILNQSEKKDWGGERHDIYSNKLTFKGSRTSGAFALKGKAVKGILTNAKMGKNGDQIPRLFSATADIYVVAHSGPVDDGIVDLMQTHAIQKSILTDKTVYFCVIDGDDMARLASAFPAAFGLS